jgi:predicted Zn-dependent protease with MMP-like domain
MMNADTMKVVSDLKNSMNAMMELHSKALAQIPDSYATQKEKIMNDLSAIPKHVETKDFASINALLSKYANNDSK